MKTIKELNIIDWSGYNFKEMVNVLDIIPEHIMVNDFKGCKDRSVLFNLCYAEENGVLHIVFNDVECIFKKSGVYSYLIFCDNDNNMMNNYFKIVDKVREEIISWTVDEDNLFDLGNFFSRFRFRTDDNLVYDKKINMPVVVISLSSTIKNKNTYYFNFRLQKCF